MTWGTPTPATMRVVQIEPGPTPTFTASTPASMSACAPSRVATLPPMTSMWANVASVFSRVTMSMTPCDCPFAVSTTITSTPASRRASARSHASPKKPIAAPTRSRPWSSFVARGYFSLLSKSLIVMSPASLPASSMSGSFSTRCCANRAMTSFAPMPARPVTSPSVVITSRTLVVCRSKPDTKRMSRFVMMPTSVPASSITGRPEMRYCAQSLSTSSIVASGVVVIGSVIMPDSLRLTWSTIAAWSAMERFRCRMPRPPSRAIAIAMRASLTVSIAADSSGVATVMRRVTREDVSASDGMTSVCPGRSSTSS